MVDVTEPTRIQHKLDRQWELLEEADIVARDKAAIESFVEWRRDTKDKARNTQIADLKALRLASDRGEVPLVDCTLEDVEAIFSTLVTPTSLGGYGLDADGSSMFNYKRALRLFYRYMDKRESWADYPWHDDLELPDIDIKGSKDREAMLTGDDIAALKQAAEHPRDRALIALLADMAGRIGLLLSLRVGDAYLDGDEPYITPNENVPDGLKNISSGELPVLHSRSELRTYLNQYHPEPDTDAAPLWPVLRGYDPDNAEECAVGDSRVRGMLKDCKARAGVERPVEPHNFRRTGLTRLSNSDRLTPQEIGQIAGWSDESLYKMLKIYDYTTDAERNSEIHQSMGFSDGRDADDLADISLSSMPCGTCRETIPEEARFCPNCGAPRDEEARSMRRDIEDTSGDKSVGADPPDDATYEWIRRWARDNSDKAVEAVMEGIDD